MFTEIFFKIKFQPYYLIVQLRLSSKQAKYLLWYTLAVNLMKIKSDVVRFVFT
jgi:hypothetical protein